MTVLLIILAATAAYILLVVVKPETGCRRCRGYGTRGRRRRSCRKCGGTGTRFRPGAPLIYRGASAYQRHRANGTLTPPPIPLPRHPRPLPPGKEHP